MASQRLDSQGPLASGRQHDFDWEELSNLRLQSQTEHSSRRHNYAIDLPLAHFAEARVHIPTDVLYLELSVQGEQLRSAAQAAGANTPGARDVGEPPAVTPDKRVAHLIPLRHRAQVQPGRQRGRHVLHAVHSQLDFLAQQCVFDVLHKKAFATNTWQGVLAVSIPRSANHHKFRREPRVMRPQGLSDPAGLPEGHGTAAGAEADVARRVRHDHASKSKRWRTKCTTSRTCPSLEERLR